MADKFSEEINIGLVSDDKYAPFAGLVLYSVLKNCSKPNLIHFYLMDRGISDRNRKLIDRMVFSKGAKISYLKTNMDLSDSLKKCRHFGTETYYKFALFDSVRVKKLLYLDCDLVVLGDVSKIYYKNINKKLILAVKDFWISNKKKKSLGISSKEDYFNAGVLLIDCKKWKSEDLTSKVINYLQNNPQNIDFGDQDGLNAILKGKWGEIHYSWNILARTGFYYLLPFLFPKHSKNELEYGVTKLPNIIHYAGLFKPWFNIDPISFKSVFKEYISQTPWKNYARLDNSFSIYLDRLIKYLNYVRIMTIYFIKYI